MVNVPKPTHPKQPATSNNLELPENQHLPEAQSLKPEAQKTYSAFNSPHMAMAASYGLPMVPFGWSHDFLSIEQ